MSVIVDDVRRRIEEKHAQALRALDVLREYLGSEQKLLVNGDDGFTAPVKQRKKRGRQSSNRNAVLSAIREEWKTVDELVESTGLVDKQVRGVLYAPVLKDKIDKRDTAEGNTSYKVKAESDLFTE